MADSPLSSSELSAEVLDSPAPSLYDIQRVVADELKEFDEYFREAMRSEVGLLDKITQYILRQKGKRIRPTLVLLTAKACGGITETSYRGAALVELMHTATLVHDDVVDDAQERRGLFSINALWKNKIAVLMGDFLLSQGLLLSLSHKDYRLLHILSEAVSRMSEGELLQIEKSRHLNIDEDTYYRIISDKTASLIAACTMSGGYSVDASEERIKQMRAFGESLGLAFQIRDDLFDFGTADVGKPLGIDLQEKKITLPLIHALRSSSKKERRAILKIVRQDEKDWNDIKRIRRFVQERGGIDYARNAMRQHARDALHQLASLPPTPARDALVDLVAFTVARSR